MTTAIAGAHRAATAPVAPTAEVRKTTVQIDLDASYEPLVAELSRVTAARAELEALEKQLKAELMATAPGEVEDHPEGVTYAFLIGNAVRYKIVLRGRSGINAKLLAEAFPEAAEACATKTVYRQVNL